MTEGTTIDSPKTVVDSLKVINHLYNLGKRGGKFPPSRKPQAKPAPTVTNNIFDGRNLRTGGFMGVEGDNFFPAGPISSSYVREFPPLGPTLSEVRADITFTAHHVPSDNKYTVTIEGPKVLRESNAWKKRREAATARWAQVNMQHTFKPLSKIEQVTPSWYSSEELSPLRAFRLSRFLTYKSPKIQGSFRHPVAMTAITERGLKIRVASKHPPYVAHYSRCVSRHLLPFLKDLKWARDSLRGDGDISLVNKDPEAQLFSADLSAASDYIDHNIGQATLRGLLEGLELPQAEIETALRCLEPMALHTVQNEQLHVDETTRGAHMGLGTTWTVLSLLNAFCGFQASDNWKSFKICGDDLIALWTPDQVATYKRWINRIGLVLNESKSFYGPSGVFCEKLLVMRKDGNGCMRASQVLNTTCLKEVMSIKRVMEPEESERIRHIASNSLLLKEVRAIAQWQLYHAKLPKYLPDGPVALGCNGRGPISLRHVKSRIKAFLLYGPCTIAGGAGSAGLKPKLGELRKRKIKVRCKGAIPYQDAEVRLRSDDRAELVAKHHPWGNGDRQFFEYIVQSASQNRKLIADARKAGKRQREISPEDEQWTAYTESLTGQERNAFTWKTTVRRWLKLRVDRELRPAPNEISMREAIEISPFIKSRTRSRLTKLENGVYRDKLTVWRSKINLLLNQLPASYCPPEVVGTFLEDSMSTNQRGLLLPPRWEKARTA